MKNINSGLSLSSDSRIQDILEEAENELLNLEPEIVYLEGLVSKLTDLKLKKNRLLSLKASLKAILNQENATYKNVNNLQKEIKSNSEKYLTSLETGKNLTYNDVNLELNSFIPEVALNQVKQFLRTNNNLNYEIFKAVVYNAGEATTEEIKEYLVNNKIKQPKTGKLFDNVELKDISSRANYLVRKKLLISSGQGRFKSTLGYASDN